MKIKVMTQGQSQAIQILVAHELGLNPGYIDEAKRYLRTQKMNHILIGHFALEAHNCVKLINEKQLLQEAKKIAEKYLQIIKS